MLKNNYMKIGKKNYNNVDADVVQRDYSNIKRYATLQLLTIYRYKYRYYNL